MAFRLPKRPNDLRFVSQIARTGEKKSKVRVGGYSPQLAVSMSELAMRQMRLGVPILDFLRFGPPACPHGKREVALSSFATLNFFGWRNALDCSVRRGRRKSNGAYSSFPH